VQHQKATAEGQQAALDKIQRTAAQHEVGQRGCSVSRLDLLTPRTRKAFLKHEQFCLQLG